MENSKRFVSLVGIKELLKKSRYQRSICNKERKLTFLTVVLEIIFLHGANEITAKSYEIQMMPKMVSIIIHLVQLIIGSFLSDHLQVMAKKRRGGNTQLFLLFFHEKKLIILSLEDAFSDIALLELANWLKTKHSKDLLSFCWKSEEMLRLTPECPDSKEWPTRKQKEASLAREKDEKFQQLWG